MLPIMFSPQINRFTKILIEKDPETYEDIRVDRDVDPGRPTMLHLAAERNFVQVAKTLVEQCHGLLIMKTKKHNGDQRQYLPVEIALMSFKDDVAAYLITKMNNEW